MPYKCKFEEGCNKQAIYNIPGETKGLFCGKHKKDDMEDVVSQKCIFEECKKIASFNIPGEKSGLYCNSHREEGMINVKSKNKRCIFEGCDIRGNFNTPGQKSGLYCAKHRKESMEDVVRKRCIFEGCNKNSIYNTPGEKSGLYCKDHREEGMVDVVNKKCIFEGCNKYPTYNIPGETKALFCKEHREDGMVNVVNKKCIIEGCDTRPYYNTPGKTSGLYCNSHREDSMVDVIHKRCKNDWCDTISNPKYEGYCAYCYINDPKNADKPILRNFKTKEIAVRDYILEKYKDFTWICDKRIQDGCSRRRPDLMLDLGNQVIIIEVDENQHTAYDCSCENKRLMEISKDINHRKLIFIRFNPDSYKTSENKTINSCWKIDKRSGLLTLSSETNWDDRLKVLEETLKYWINNETNKMIEIVELFYDGFE